MRIEHLPKEKWKGTILPIGYMTKEYYDVSVEHSQKGFLAELIRKTFDAPVAVQADTTAMSQPYLIDYTLTFASASVTSAS